MKKTILITTSLLLVSCGHDTTPATTPTTPTVYRNNTPSTPAQPGRYIARPGQAIIDTNAAFDQQAAAYANPGAGMVTPANPYEGVQIHYPVQTPAAGGANAPVMIPGPYGVTSPVVANPDPNAYAQQLGTPYLPGTATGTGIVAGGPAVGNVAGMLPNTPSSPAVSGPVNYTMRISNATRGRIFVEAHDAAGEIYPCGFLTEGQHEDSEKNQVAPIKGPITVVVRDPDKPGSPELRRYKVDPPKDYAGKTVEITIISGGRYQVSVDGQVRFITPAPVPNSAPKPVVIPPTNTVGTVTGMEPATPATPAGTTAPAAAKPATPVAPAPAATPAGM